MPIKIKWVSLLIMYRIHIKMFKNKLMKCYWEYLNYVRMQTMDKLTIIINLILIKKKK
jgi:hypothetical protein